MKTYNLSGTIYFTPVDALGVATGPKRRGGNLYPLTIQVGAKTVSQISKEHDRSGQTIATLTNIESITGSCILRQMDERSFAWAVAGLAAAMAGAGGDIVDETATALPAGDYITLANKRLSAVVVKNSVGDTTYIEGTDYILNASLGIFTITAGGNIADTDELKVSYTFAAGAGHQVTIGTDPTIRVKMEGTLINDFDGSELLVELDLVTLTSSDGINLISEPDTEYEELALDMILDTPPGKTYPGTITGVLG